MADTKISALTTATTPLDGTEVVPVVQSTTTKKVAVSDLTAGRAISALSVSSTTIGAGSGSSLSLIANGASKATLDTSGNIGFGVTPSAWNANGRGIQLYNTGSKASGLASYYGGVGLFNDCYFGTDNNFKYYSGGAAAHYEMASGVHLWEFAGSGTAGATITFTQAMKLDASGNLTILSGSLGYGTGSGGAVTQITSRTTGVTLDKSNGSITLVSAAGTTTWQTFTVTNNKVAATDTIIVNQKSGTDLNEIHVTAVAAGSFNISFRTTGGTTTEQPVFNFAVIKAVAA